jgi:hypothetical protein
LGNFGNPHFLFADGLFVNLSIGFHSLTAPSWNEETEASPDPITSVDSFRNAIASAQKPASVQRTPPHFLQER